MSEFEPGLYRHFRGGLYFAMMEAVCEDPEPLEGTPFIVYVSTTSGLWSVRSSASFFADMGPGVRRFERVEDQRLDTGWMAGPVAAMVGLEYPKEKRHGARYLQSPDAGRSSGQKP